MNTALQRSLILFALSLSAAIVGCATGEVKGVLTTPNVDAQARQPVGRINIIFMDRFAMQPSGLSALRVGTPAYLTENESLSRAYRAISAELIRLLPDPSISVLTQSSVILQKDPARISHVVLVSPRSLKTSPSQATADVEVSIREEATKRVLWKGESTITSGAAENNKAFAAGIVRAMQESGLVRPTPR